MSSSLIQLLIVTDLEYERLSAGEMVTIRERGVEKCAAIKGFSSIGSWVDDINF